MNLPPLAESNNLGGLVDEFNGFFVDKVTIIKLKIIEKWEIKDRQYYISERPPDSTNEHLEISH